MKKLIIIALLFVLAPAAFASTNVYVPESGSCYGYDHAVWEMNGGVWEVASCIPEADWRASQSVNLETNDDLIKVPRGMSFMTTYGYEDSCPIWFPMDCVVESSSFKHWIIGLSIWG